MIRFTPGTGRPRHVTVVGGGIIGLACASYLLREGLGVTIVEQNTPGEGCSRGNAGLLAPGSCVPLAMPGVMGQVPKWLLDPDAPFSLRWTYAIRAIPWLMRFVAESSQRRALANAVAQRAIIADTFANYDPLLKDANAAHLVRRTGYMYLYESEDSFTKSKAMWRLRTSLGVRTETLDATQIREREPSLSRNFHKAVFLPDEGYCTNPLELSKALARQFVMNGGIIERRVAKGFTFGDHGPSGLVTDAGVMDLDYLVIAAGAYSHRLASKLGSSVPLESLRGYNVTIHDPGVHPRIPLMMADRKLAITPMEPNLLRASGVVEIAGLQTPPSRRRKAHLVGEIQRVFHDVKTEHVTEWLGHRPALPDSVPVISASPKYSKVFFAFGHGIAGLTGASTTGRMIADMVTGRSTGIDMTPYRIDRFGLGQIWRR